MQRSTVLAASFLFVASVALGDTTIVIAGRGSTVIVPGGKARSIKGSGREATETRPVSGAQSLVVMGAIDVTFTTGEPEQVLLTADDNILPLIETEVSNGILHLGSKGGYTTRLGVKAEIRLRRLESIELSGSGDIAARVDPTPSFAVSIRGSGDIAVRGVDASRVSSSVSGSGHASLAGRCEHLDVDIRGSGDVNAGDLACAEADVSISGSGDANVNASARLGVTVRGSGDVEYAGSPVLSQEIRGSGSVSKSR